jgi:hypothetical protein
MSDRIRTQPPPFQALASDPPGESEAPAFCSWLRFAKVCQIQLRSHGADGACASRGRSTAISTVRTLLNSPTASLDADTTARRCRFPELARALPGEARRCPCPPTGLPTRFVGRRRARPRASGPRSSLPVARGRPYRSSPALPREYPPSHRPRPPRILPGVRRSPRRKSSLSAEFPRI